MENKGHDFKKNIKEKLQKKRRKIIESKRKKEEKKEDRKKGKPGIFKNNN